MFHTGAIKTTARKLIHDRLGRRPIGRRALRAAIEDVMFTGWVPNYVPAPHEFERSMIFVPHCHPYAAIFRCLGRDFVGVVPRGLIESRTSAPLRFWSSGFSLSRYGLAIVSMEGNNVILRGTSVGMAAMVNTSRYGAERSIRSQVLVECATGLCLRPELINDALRVQAAVEFEAFSIDVPGLNDGASHSEVLSRWHFPSPPPHAASHSTAPTPIDPDPPPF